MVYTINMDVAHSMLRLAKGKGIADKNYTLTHNKDLFQSIYIKQRINIYRELNWLFIILIKTSEFLCMVVDATQICAREDIVSKWIYINTFYDFYNLLDC